MKWGSVAKLNLDHALSPAFDRFAELLGRRLGRGVFTSEDAVRYTFFAGLLEGLNLAPEDIILEHDHSKISKAKIDTFIPRSSGESFAIEFKYDRPIPSKGNQPRTQKAGQVIKDFFRLARFDESENIKGVFIYLTSKEMAGYFRNPQNGLARLFDLAQGSTIRIDEIFLQAMASTLRGAAGDICPCTAAGLFSCALPADHELRIYEVRP
jgi:hypothetical protein